MDNTNISQQPPIIGSITTQRIVAIHSSNKYWAVRLFPLRRREQEHVSLLDFEPQTIPDNGIYIQRNIYLIIPAIYYF